MGKQERPEGAEQCESSGACFAPLDDPGVERTTWHALAALVTSAGGGVICGADSWVEIEAWGQAKEAWFATVLDWPPGLPAHDTCGRVVAARDPLQFAACLRAWSAGVGRRLGRARDRGVGALDGKTTPTISGLRQ